MRASLLMVLALGVLALAGCGSSAGGSSAGGASAGGVSAGHLPAGWRLLRLPSGATLPYPPGWHTISGDPGSRSAALLGPGDSIVGYLNATPADDQETLAGWTRFRLSHNAEDGDHSVHVLWSKTDVALDGGHGSCVSDRYATSRFRYREIACLVSVKAKRTVLVAAAQPRAWSTVGAHLRYAIDHFTS